MDSLERTEWKRMATIWVERDKNSRANKESADYTFRTDTYVEALRGGDSFTDFYLIVNEEILDSTTGIQQGELKKSTLSGNLFLDQGPVEIRLEMDRHHYNGKGQEKYIRGYFDELTGTKQ